MSSILAKKKLLMAQSGGIDVSEVYNTSVWTGTGADRTITTGIDSGEGALVWIKNRGIGRNHVLFDTVRGAGVYLSSNLTTAESTNLGMLSGFGGTGFNLGANASVNASAETYVGWQFRRAEKFFDIVQYTGDGVSGRQIAHNLGVKPGMMVVKHANAVENWVICHRSTTASQFAVFTSSPVLTSDEVWNGTEPTDEVFTLGTSPSVNTSGGTYISYLFAHDSSPEGLIQCGSYTGNGSATGPVVNLGWSPQYLMIKNATATGDWQILDAQRGLTATNDAILLANTAGAETSANLANPSSTGFQISSTVSNVNTSGQTYVYMAIREAA